MAGTRRLNDLIQTTRTQLRLPDGPLVVGLSGGADSAALALMVIEAGREARALHVDHGLTHSPSLRAAASAIADKLGIDLDIVEVEVPEGASPEGQARTTRYRAFSETVAPDESLLIGHTAEDNLETVLINMVRGTGTRGLAGIPERRPPGIHRPILGLSRSQTREMAVLAGLPFVDDPMNLEPELTRNYLRARVIPLLTALNPGLAGAVTRMSIAVRADADFLDELAAGHPIELTPGRARCAVGDLIAVPPAVGDRVLMRMLAHVCGEGEMSWDRVERMREVLQGEASQAQIAGSAMTRRVGPFLEVADHQPEDRPPVALAPGVHHVGSLVFEVMRRDEVCRVAPLSRWHAIFPGDAVLVAETDGAVLADGEPAWEPGRRRLPVAWYRPGDVGYLSVFAREESGWTSSP
jgi:tRNA(Ile)-lysidine synthase